MSNLRKRIVLHNSKTAAVKRFHPWIFSGAIKTLDSGIQEGDVVNVYSAGGEYLAIGHYAPGNIAIKILAFEEISSLEQLFLDRFHAAFSLRKQIGLTLSESTNCYRLINSEGDGLPGLIVDWYNGTIVLQAYSVGMFQQRHLIVDCLKTLYREALKAVYDKSASVMPKEQVQTGNGYLLGGQSDGLVVEHGHRFYVDWEDGQKTGFFLDQRDNRQRLARYVQGQRVLNTFSYSGGFSVYAASAGAAFVRSVDSSAKAIAWTNQNIALNSLDSAQHDAIAADVFDFLKGCRADYDVVVLDPPAFAKTLSARHQAVMAYKRLNQFALNALRPGGILFTFSCSQVVTPDLFKGAVTAGAIESGRQVRILEHLTQPGDHPVSIYHPEGLYLKGLVLAVE